MAATSRRFHHGQTESRDSHWEQRRSSRAGSGDAMCVESLSRDPRAGPLTPRAFRYVRYHHVRVIAGPSSPLLLKLERAIHNPAILG